MIPRGFIHLERMPLTANGKLDERALPAPASSAARAGLCPRAVRTGAEEIVVGIWRTLLHLEDLGPDDNVYDHGAQSLVAVQARNKMQTAFGKQIPMVILCPASDTRRASRESGERRNIGTAGGKRNGSGKEASRSHAIRKGRAWLSHLSVLRLSEWLAGFLAPATLRHFGRVCAQVRNA